MAHIRNLFCLVYALARKAVDYKSATERPDPSEVRFSAVLILAFLESLLVIGADAWVRVFEGPAMLGRASKPLIVAGFLAMCGVNYLVAVRRDAQWREFDRDFRALPEKSRRRGMFVAGAAIVFPIAFVALAFAFLANKS